MSVDVVRELITRLIDAAHREGTLTESVALEVERSFRAEFKGEKYEIFERPREHSQKRREVVISAYLEGQPVEQITQHHGISRATLYRYLKK